MVGSDVYSGSDPEMEEKLVNADSGGQSHMNTHGSHLGCPCRAQVTAHQNPTWGRRGNVGWLASIAIYT